MPYYFVNGPQVSKNYFLPLLGEKRTLAASQLTIQKKTLSSHSLCDGKLGRFCQVKTQPA